MTVPSRNRFSALIRKWFLADRRLPHSRSTPVRRVRLSFDQLEDRTVLSPVPLATLNVPAQNFIGENLDFDVSFQNASGTPTDVGYGPFIDLVLPYNGALGNHGTSTPNGINFLSATYLGQPVTATVQTFPGPGVTGTVNDPYAVDTTNTPLPVQGTAGDELVTLQLPFGSFTPGQPAADVVVHTSLSNLAVLGTPLPIEARAGFQYGADPLNDPSTDPSIVNSFSNNSATWSSESVTPTLIKLTKTYLGPEQETATGPDFPHQYLLNVDVANGQTINNLDITDVLPNNMQFVSVNSVTGTGTTLVTTPAGNTATTTTPGGILIRQLNQVTGTTGSDDAQLLFTFYIPRDDNMGNQVLDLTSGAFTTSTDQASAQGTWTPIDPRQSTTTVTSNVATNTITDKSIAIQKSVADVIDTGALGPTPGDTLLYTLNIQVSDFFAFNNLVALDQFSDGQSFDPTYMPTLTVTEQGSTTSGTLATANYVLGSQDGTTGITPLTFNLSNELLSRAFFGGMMLGGSIPPGGTGSSATLPSPTPSFGAATATITFRTTINDAYNVTYPSGDAAVDEGDVLSNNVNVTGNVLSYSNLTPDGNTRTDNSSAGVTIARGVLSKSIYAINGNTTVPATSQVSPGDMVTYRLQYTLPTSSAESVVLSDFLPLPVFSATEVTTFNNTTTGIPAAGQAQYGPGATFHSIFPTAVPTVTTDAAANSVAFNFGTFNDPQNRTSTIDILFTVTVSDQPFADGLFLTNQAHESEGSTFDQTATANAIVQIKVDEPSIVAIRKGIVSTDDPANQFSAPISPAGVTFQAPDQPANGGGGQFTGLIDSANLGSSLNANVSGVDAGDLVKFVLTVQNTGSSPHGAFDITFTDNLPAGFAIPSTVQGLNLNITDGSGIPLNYVGLGGGPDGINGTPDDLFGNGIELVDPSSTEGALAPGQDANGNVIADGHNIAIVTFDLALTGSVTPQETITNTATLANYAGTPGGPNYTGLNGNNTDTATTTIASPSASKILVGTSITNANNSATQAVIGETATYSVTVTVPEGQSPNLAVVDTLGPGLAFVALTGVSRSSTDLTTTQGTGDFSQVSDFAPTVTGNGLNVTFNLGTVTNANRDNSVAETITLTYTAVVLDVAGNQSGTQLRNSAQVTWAGGNIASVSAPSVTVIEPKLLSTKTVVVNGSGTTGDAGDPVLYTITLSQPAASQTDAFNVTFLDNISTLINVAGYSVVDSAGLVTAADITLTGNTLQTASANGFDWLYNPSRTITITVTGTLTQAVMPGQVIPNNADLYWTSLPGNPGQISSYNTNSTERTGAGGVDDYFSQSTADVQIVTPTPVKMVVATSEASTAGNNVAIGEIVHYHLATVIAEGSAPGFVLIDNMPAGLEFLNDGTATVAFVANQAGISSSGPLAISGAGLDITGNTGNVTPTFALPDINVSSSATSNVDNYGSGTSVYFKMGDLANGDRDADSEYVVVEFNALVLNVTGNHRGVNLDNTYTVQVNNTNIATSAAARVTVVEPNVTVAKTVTTVPTDAGDTVVYSIVITNNTSVGNVSTAFDVHALDTLNANLTINNPATDVAVVSQPGYATVTNNSTAGAVDVSINQLQPGNSVTLQVTAHVSATAVAGVTIPNSVAVTYTSLPGTGTQGNPTGSNTPGGSGAGNGERDGSGGAGTLNGYDSSASASVTLATPQITKQFADVPDPTSEPSTTGSNVAIGETVSYDLLVTLPEGVTQNLVVTDTPAAGLGYVGYSIITTAGGRLAADYNGTLPAPVVTASGGSELFTFGNVTTADDNVADNNAFVIRVTAHVLNVGGNVTGTTLPNHGSLTYTNGTSGTNTTVNSPMDPTVTVVQPQLTIAKTFSITRGDAGDPVTVTLTMQNTGNATAFDVTLADPINPANLTNIAAGTTPAGFTFGYAANTVTYTGPSIAPNTTLTFAFTANLTTTVAPGTTVGNTATVTQYSSLPGAVPGERTYGPVSGSATLTVNTNAISGFVYRDNNNNGSYEPGLGETGIGSVAISLTGTDYLGNTVNVMTTTAANDSYSFTGLRPGTYQLAETQPAGFLSGKDTSGTMFGGTANSAADQITGITIPRESNTAGVSYNFGELVPASVAGFVYEDSNNDGIKQAGEPFIPGVAITLTGTDDLGNMVNQTTTTSAVDGSYSFTNLRPGSYGIQETQPAAYLDGKDTIGTQGGTTTNDRFSVNLNAGVTGTMNNFGELRPAQIGGFVYDDSSNDNGVKDPGEPGISGVTLTLTGTNDLGNMVSQTTTTAADGSYSFGTLRPGTYQITETQPAAYLEGKDAVGTQGGSNTINDVISGAVLTEGTNGQNNNFGELRPSSLSGFVYQDTNNNGMMDPSENGIHGVTVTLTGTDDVGNAVNQTFVTGSTGAYSFTNLRPGTYTVVETQPSNWVEGKDTLGISSGNAATQDQFTNVVLGGGVNATGYLFGELAPVVTNITGQVKTTLCGLVYNRSTRLWSESVTFTNTSAVTMTGTFQMVLNNLPPGVTLTNASGYTPGGSPFILVTQSSLAPGATLSVLLQFSTTGAPVSFTTQLYSGVY